MSDVIRLALETDSSRFVSFHLGGGGGVVPLEGVDEGYHTLSHHGRDEDKLDQLAIVDAYCRYHYLLFWKKIQVRKKILTEGKLQKYIEDLTARYPDKFLEILRKDLRSEKDFLAAIMELELDEGSGEDSNYEEEEDRSFIDEVRGVTESARSNRDDDEY